MMKMICAGLAAAVLSLPPSARAAGEAAAAKQTVLGWPDASRQVAELMIDRYGGPDRLSSDRLDWFDRGDLKRIVVRALALKGPGILETTVRYDAPRGAIGLLSLKDCVVVPNGDAGELSAFSDDEASGVLALNVAHEVMTGRRTVDSARAFYAETLEMRAAGKSSRYTDRLLFTVRARKRVSFDSLPSPEGN
jgi:hypothetical protein